jgi:hypothetical protein
MSGHMTQNARQYNRFMGFEHTIVAIVMVLYAIVGISYAIKGDFPWALVWFSYAMANVGLMWAASSKH